MPGFGRLSAIDERDSKYPSKLALLEPPEIPEYRFWAPPRTILDQNGYPHCVAYSWKHWLTTSPMRQGGNLSEVELYREAQKVDEWPGESYDGTSIRAGAKILKKMGYIGSYLWANTLEELKRWILTNGPAVIGIDWHSAMVTGKWGTIGGPTSGFWIIPEGSVEGEHACLVVGWSRPKRAFRILNSWGEEWGERGKAWIAEEHVQYLLEKRGEICMAVEFKAIPQNE